MSLTRNWKVKQLATELSESIWKPIGEKPKPLWKTDCIQFNATFKCLFGYLQTHQHYSYVHNDYDLNDVLIREYGTTLQRIRRWLEWHGLIIHEEARVFSEKEQKKVMVHYLKATAKGWKAFEEGMIVDCDDVKVGIGGNFAEFKEYSKWLDKQYEALKVANWRQEKWLYEFKDLFYTHLTGSAVEMMKLTERFLREHLATIQSRRKFPAKVIAQLQLTSTKQLTEWVKGFGMERPEDGVGGKESADNKTQE